MFTELEQVVNAQEDVVQHTEENAIKTQEDVDRGNTEITKATEHARRRNRLRRWCILVVILIIIAIALGVGLGVGLVKGTTAATRWYETADEMVVWRQLYDGVLVAEFSFLYSTLQWLCTIVTFHIADAMDCLYLVLINKKACPVVNHKLLTHHHHCTCTFVPLQFGSRRSYLIAAGVLSTSLRFAIMLYRAKCDDAQLNVSSHLFWDQNYSDWLRLLTRISALRFSRCSRTSSNPCISKLSSSRAGQNNPKQRQQPFEAITIKPFNSIRVAFQIRCSDCAHALCPLNSCVGDERIRRSRPRWGGLWGQQRKYRAGFRCFPYVSCHFFFTNPSENSRQSYSLRCFNRGQLSIYCLGLTDSLHNSQI